MKKFATLLLLLHALVEGVMGSLMVVAPRQLLATAGPSEQGLMMTYGFAAITMALLVAWYWPHRRHAAAVAITMATLATFHTGLTLAAAMMASRGDNAIAIVFIHGAFAAGFWLLWARRARLADASATGAALRP